MLKINKDQKRLPFGGHHYYEDGLMMKGEDFNEVKQKLTDYRVNNNRPLGNPGQDILTYYAINFPWMVKEDDVEMPEEPADFLDWRHWISRTWVKPPKKTLTIKEASMRWETCKTCPHNVELPVGREVEMSQLNRKSFMLRKGVETPKEIKYCALHRFDIRVSSFLETPKDYSNQKKDDSDYPGCWV